MARLFGTDGVRGTANRELTADLALRLSVSAARVLLGSGTGERLKAVVGRDTRISGEFLEAAVVAGLASAGVDVTRLGVIPTPGVAFLVDALGADLGVVLSASHNPMPDNGIKFLGRGGVKLPDHIEDEIEAHLGDDWDLPVGADVGQVHWNDAAHETYVRHLIGSLEGGQPLAGLKVVLDTANGAAYRTAVEAFTATGATVRAINDSPDGLNINRNAGSTHLEGLQREVVAFGADLGLAFDGDADRCLAVDHTGAVVDGDQIMAILAIAMKGRGELHDDTIAATVMSNIGFHKAMKAHGITVSVNKVGDRYVLEDMNVNGFTLGGEQSGHVILRRYATTGDGVLTGLQLAQVVAAGAKTLRELASVMDRFPQVLVNVSGVNKNHADIDPVLNAAVAAAERELGGSGRVLLRPSGTEPLVRVMVEAPTQEQADEIAARLAAVVKDRLAR
ncbi:MAG: phosphoglucosamine mutase [Propionibacteriaceae bacterium]|jgi:phosphoglucosamine mutase|nr:phosphoglucosamine mutase [Propionibacteriaceae bacterium]